ncbi:hypothetical protein SLA2020_092790 [Shorea laevis]
MHRNHALITANIASLPFLISFVLNSYTLSGDPLPHPRVKSQPTQVLDIDSRQLLVGENWVCIYASGLLDIKPPSPLGSSDEDELDYKQSGRVDEVFLLPRSVPGRGAQNPDLVRNSEMKILAAPNIAHLQCTSFACTLHLRVSRSHPVQENPISKFTN